MNHLRQQDRPYLAAVLARIVALALAVPIAAMVVTSLHAQQGPVLPPLPQQTLQKLASDPEAWRQFLAQHATVPPGEPVSTAPINGVGWTLLENLLPGINAPYSASNPQLLTDGTVLVHVSCTSTNAPNGILWYRLKPDSHGNYQKGTWSLVAPMVASNSQVVDFPRFFSSAVLPDGRMIVEGGEYDGTGCTQIESSLGSIYDPRTNFWTPVPPPAGWTQIGDASGIVLSNGTFLLANPFTTEAALFNATTLGWTGTGSGKFDQNSEENWTLLPNGNVLTVDAYVSTGTCGTNTEEYQAASGSWATAGSTINELSGCSGSITNFEGPTQILMPDATVAAFGATASLGSENLPVYTALYDTITQSWSAGPNMPQVDGVYYTMADAPAAILPNGKVLIAASPSVWTNKSSYPSPTHFFVFDGTKFTRVGDVADSGRLRSFEMNFLVLPTGQILGVETDLPNMEIFPALCCADPDWAPTITTFPATIVEGTTYTISGTQFNGLTSGAAYGDDDQMNTNYPLVRVTNTSSKEVAYCPTFNFSTMGVDTGSTLVSADFTCNAPAGASTLEVVANGIASAPVNVQIHTKPATTLYSFCSGFSCPDGAVPMAGLIMDTSQNLYGTTSEYGNGSYPGGTVFELTFDPSTQEYSNAVQSLYNFCSQPNCSDGSSPTAGVIIDASRNLYGTTEYGGTGDGEAGNGTVFEVPFDAGTQQYGTLQTLYTFCALSGEPCPDGALPEGSLIMDASGNLYGTTLLGGTGNGGDGGYGTLFEVPFDADTQQYGTLQTLYSFCSQANCIDGAEPHGALTIDASGNLYGATIFGGRNNLETGGTVFELAFDPTTKQYASAVTTLYSFCSFSNCTDGYAPTGGLVFDNNENLYGTTIGGGLSLYSGGTVFELPYQASAVQVLYNFCSKSNCTDGYDPFAGLIMDDSGNLYGTTEYGGSSATQTYAGNGTVFELPFDAATQTYASSLQTLYDCTPDANPAAPLLMDGLSGTLYGTATVGGTSGAEGALFTLTH